MSRERVRRAIRWLGGHERSVLIALGVAAAAVWAFVAIADEVVERETHDLDERILLAMREPANHDDPIGPQWFEEMARDVTALGGSTAVVGATLAVVGYLLLRRDRWRALLVVGAVVGAQLLSSGLKQVFDVPRPDLVERFSYVYTASFPSGHSTVSAAVYLTFATQLAELERSIVIRGYLLAVAVVLIAAIGASRVYLGVHWPSDVAAGWAAGTAWALLIWAIARMIARHRARRGEPEPATDSAAAEPTDDGPAAAPA